MDCILLVLIHDLSLNGGRNWIRTVFENLFGFIMINIEVPQRNIEIV